MAPVTVWVSDPDSVLMTVYLVGVAALLILLLIGALLRRRRLREKYALLWVAVGVLVLAVAAFPATLDWASHLVGVKVPSNLLFAGAVAFLISVALHLSLEVTALEDESRILAEEVTILRAEVSELRADILGRPEQGK